MDMKEIANQMKELEIKASKYDDIKETVKGNDKGEVKVVEDNELKESLPKKFSHMG